MASHFLLDAIIGILIASQLFSFIIVIGKIDRHIDNSRYQTRNNNKSAGAYSKSMMRPLLTQISFIYEKIQRQ